MKPQSSKFLLIPINLKFTADTNVNQHPIFKRMDPGNIYHHLPVTSILVGE